jgi:hypothetical protein
MLEINFTRVLTQQVIHMYIITVPHNKSGLVPRSSLSGAGQLGFWETGEGGTTGEGWGK